MTSYPAPDGVHCRPQHYEQWPVTQHQMRNTVVTQHQSEFTVECRPQHYEQHLPGAPLRGGCTPSPNWVGPNLPHLSCSDPFGLEQRTLGIASVVQGTRQFIALNEKRACSARQAEARQPTSYPAPDWVNCLKHYQQLPVTQHQSTITSYPAGDMILSTQSTTPVYGSVSGDSYTSELHSHT